MNAVLDGPFTLSERCVVSAPVLVDSVALSYAIMPTLRLLRKRSLHAVRGPVQFMLFLIQWPTNSPAVTHLSRRWPSFSRSPCCSRRYRLCSFSSSSLAFAMDPSCHSSESSSSLSASIQRHQFSSIRFHPIAPSTLKETSRTPRRPQAQDHYRRLVRTQARAHDLPYQ